MPNPESAVSPWWMTFLTAIDLAPKSQQPERLAKLARELIARGERDTARILILRALKLLRELDAPGGDDFRAALRALTPGYHIQISTDTDRIASWEAALTSVARPGMLALEIGTGSGILAMLAARAGAEVVSCERDILMAELASKVVRQNGYSERIRIIGKPVENIRIPDDLRAPADLLVLDLFSDHLFTFAPFEVIAAAARLLAPNAVAVPMSVSLECALAHFRRWNRTIPGMVAGLDLSGLRDLAPGSIGLDAGDFDLALRSPAQNLVTANLPHDLPPQRGGKDLCLISTGGPVNGVAVWLRLKLAPGHILEARPGCAPLGFYAKPTFHAFHDCMTTSPGDLCRVGLNWQGKSLSVGFIGAATK